VGPVPVPQPVYSVAHIGISVWTLLAAVLTVQYKDEYCSRHQEYQMDVGSYESFETSLFIYII